MINNLFTKLVSPLAFGVMIAFPPNAVAQNFGSSGASWSGGWGFSSATDRSVNLQTAQAIKSARYSGPSSVVTQITDNRTNYVEYDAATGSEFVSDFQIGNDSTNTIGAMNTGDMSVTVDGEGNTVDVSSAADSVGCQNGSILSSVLGTASPLVANSDGSFSPSGNVASVNLGQDVPGCS